jgi:hypothetical protein
VVKWSDRARAALKQSDPGYRLTMLILLVPIALLFGGLALLLDGGWRGLLGLGCWIGLGLVIWVIGLYLRRPVNQPREWPAKRRRI